MGKGRKIGKLLLGISRGARRVSEGMDMVFGEDRTMPGDGFSKERAGKRAGDFTRKARRDNNVGNFADRDKDFFGEKSSEENDSRRFI